MDWFDGCQNCVVQDGEILMCTNRFCYDLTSGFCRQFKDGRLCQDVDCLQPSYVGTQVYLRTTARSAQNMTVRGNPTSGNFSQPESDIVHSFAINAPFLVTMTIMAATTVILFAVLMTVGSFLLNKNKRKRQQQVTANGSGTLRQNAPITKHLKQLRSALSKHPMAIQWSEDGKSFYVPDRQRFERDVLGDHALGFKTQSFKNWAQKLRRHGFKLHKGTGGKLVGGRYSREDGLFTRDHPELDGQISRLKSANSKTSDQPLHLVDKLRAAIIRYPRIIHWSEDGLSFRVSDLRGFESKVLNDKKVGFRCSTYRNWARNLRNYGFEAVSCGKGKKGGPRRVWQHTGGHFQRDRTIFSNGKNDFQRDRPRLSNGKSDSPDTKRFRIECDGTLVNGTLISEIVPADTVPTDPTPSPQLFPIGLPPKADALACPALHFDEDGLLESTNLINLGDDSGRLHAGSFSPRLGSFSSHPGSFSSHPGSISPRLGSFSSRPGSFSSRPGSFSSRPGSFSSHPGSFSRHGSFSPRGSFSHPASCSAHANEYDVMDCKAADEMSDLLSTNESDLHLQLQMCQEDYVHELCI